MIANVIIVALIAGYSIYLIRNIIKNWKEGKSPSCAGCSGGCGGNCSGCSSCMPKTKEQ